MSAFELELLTDDSSAVSLCTEYWQLDAEGRFAHKVGDLAARHGLRSHEVADVVRRHATARSTETTCASCGIGMVFTSRADLQQRRSWYRGWKRDYICDNCQQEARERAATAAAQRAVEQRQAIEAAFSMPAAGDLDPVELTLEQAVALLAVIRAGATEDLSRITPLGTWGSRLSPSEELDLELLALLFSARILAIHDQSPADAFSWDELDPARYFPAKVAWRICDGTSEVSIGQIAAELEYRFHKRDWPLHWYRELKPLWLNLALHECLEYLRLALEDHSLSKRFGDKTRAVITNALADFAIGQVYNFIWRAARDAAAYYMRENVPKQQAANSVVGRIERFAERAIADGWDVKGYRRDRRVPETTIARTFAGIVTGLGDEYWEVAPHALAVGAVPTEAPRAEA